nr:ribonuclease H-like domain, reverse transcriptase, RNA-dependent DNA polymerase [Tanacetum cinerariifolium]
MLCMDFIMVPELGMVLCLNSDYGGANQDRKSTIGGCQFLGRRLISWQCKKQTIVATSTTEDKENIAKTSAMPHKALPRVTSLGGGEGNMQQKLQKLMDICTSLQRQHLLMEERVQSQDLEITQLKTMVKTLKDNERMREGFAQEDAPNTRGMDQWEDLLVGDTVKDSDKSADKESDSTDEIANVLGTLGATNILASGGLSKKDKGKGKMTEPEHHSKEKYTWFLATTGDDQIILGFSTNSNMLCKKEKVACFRLYSDLVFMTKQQLWWCSYLEALWQQGEKEITDACDIGRLMLPGHVSVAITKDQIIREKAKRDSKIAKIHAERELKMTIAELDRSNEMVAKYLSEYEQAEAGLSHDEVELIDKLLMYQRHLAQIKKYQAQQNKPATKTERKNFYMLILRSNAGWKAKDFKGMTF